MDAIINGAEKKQERFSSAVAAHRVVALPREIHHQKGKREAICGIDGGLDVFAQAEFKQSQGDQGANDYGDHPPADIAEADQRDIPPHQRLVGVVGGELRTLLGGGQFGGCISACGHNKKWERSGWRHGLMNFWAVRVKDGIAGWRSFEICKSARELGDLHR